MKYHGIALFILFAVLSCVAQDTNQPADHKQTLEERGNHGMGFDQQKITHHFLLTKDGGVIQVTANSADDKTTIDQIRMHLEHIAGAFASGDFDIPMFVHDQTPPGVTVLKRLRKKLAYKVELMDGGGRVVIHTANSKALHALWDFLRFQIKEHKTNDPVASLWGGAKKTKMARVEILATRDDLETIAFPLTPFHQEIGGQALFLMQGRDRDKLLSNLSC